MSGHELLADEFGDSLHLSRTAIDLCCAIAEDVEAARQFEFRRHGFGDQMFPGMPGQTAIRHASAPLVSELTTLIT